MKDNYGSVIIKLVETGESEEEFKIMVDRV